MNDLSFVETPEEFVRWATSAKPGYKISYYRGWLFKDKMVQAPEIVKSGALPVEFQTAHKAWDFYESGIVDLFQKRLGDEDYLYIAVRK